MPAGGDKGSSPRRRLTNGFDVVRATKPRPQQWRKTSRRASRLMVRQWLPA